MQKAKSKVPFHSRQNDCMHYFDIVGIDEREASPMLGLLGYRKFFYIGKDIFIGSADYANESRGKGVLVEISKGETGSFLRAIERNNVLGALASERISKNALGIIAENKKLFAFNASELICVDQKTRLRNMRRYRRELELALHLKVQAAIATFAREKENLLSSAQIIEVAKFMGADQNIAKGMVSVWGDML